MKTSVKKFAAFILAITLALPFMVFAAAQDEKAQSNEPDIAYEMPEMRNEFEKHFLMSDGTAVAATYAEPVNYYDKTDGLWKEIDNTLSLKDGRYRNKGHGGFEVSFRGENDTGDLVKMTVDGYTLSWNVSVQNVLGTKDTLKNVLSPTVNRSQDTQNNKFAAKNAGAAIKYSSPFSGSKLIDVNYAVSQYKVKEDITIYSAKDGNAVYYTYNCSELTAVLNPDNSIDFVDEAGNPIYTVHSPYMYDSAGNGSYSFRITLKQTDDICTVVMTPDKEWLNSADRVYPVVIDPTVTNNKITTNYDDTYIHSGDTAGEHSNETKMYFGKLNGVQHYALFKVHVLPTIPENATVATAELILKLTPGSNSGGPYTLRRIITSWSENSVSFSSRPLATNPVATSVDANFGALKIVFDITSHYNAVAAGTRTDYGFQIENTDETLNDYNVAYTSNCGDVSLFPVIQIHYVITSESEANNSRATANEMELSPIPGEVSSILGTTDNSSSRDYDYFKFTAPRHGKVEVHLTVAGEEAHILSAYDESSALLDTATTTSQIEPLAVYESASISFTTTKDGDLNGSLDTYYIRVHSIESSSLSSYQLIIKYTTAYAELDWQYPLDTTTGYLYNRHATSPVGTRGSSYHKGLDISATPTTVFAPTKAKVIHAGWDDELGYYVTLYTKNITDGATDPYAGDYYFVITFMHLTSFEVDVGDEVDEGTEIGLTGNTGDSSGGHLHLEIYLSNAETPTPYSNTSNKNLIINPYDFYYNTISFTGSPY